MEERYEFRINYDFAHLLFKPDEGVDLGQFTKSVKVVHLTKDDERFRQIPEIAKEIREKHDAAFFFYWEIKRRYLKEEIESAELFCIRGLTQFEPPGEICGTLYDETAACQICGANRMQKTPLILRRSSMPKKDIARTIAGEIVVSEKFVTVFRQRELKGALFEPIIFGKEISANYYQLLGSVEIELSVNTIAGINPFDFSASEEDEIYKCPTGHTIGLNLLSEAFVLSAPSILNNDFLITKQKIGVKRGLLRPEPLYLCSPDFKKMIDEEKLNGFNFEVAHIQET
jgi:hypothetical protein